MTFLIVHDHITKIFFSIFCDISKYRRGGCAAMWHHRCVLLLMKISKVQCPITARRTSDDGRLPLKNKTFVLVIKGKIGQRPF